MLSSDATGGTIPSTSIRLEATRRQVMRTKGVHLDPGALRRIVGKRAEQAFGAAPFVQYFGGFGRHRPVLLGASHARPVQDGICTMARAAK